jgi:hypothetical protein
MASSIDWDWLYDLWALPNVKAVVVTFGLTVAADIVRRILVPRGRVAWGISSNEHFIVPPLLPDRPQAINVLTRQIFIQNVGRAIAEDVQITINFHPQHWHVFPPIAIVIPNDQDRFLRLQVPMLNRREHFVISMFSANQIAPSPVQLPVVNAVRWKGGVAKEVLIVPRQKLSGRLERILVIFMYFGVICATYLIIRLALFIF